jgi:hypothetical protein
MENREIRLLNKARHRVSPALRALSAAALLLAFALPNDCFAGGCDSNMAGEPAVYQATVQVRARLP